MSAEAPLRGATVVVTRRPEDVEALVARVEAAGAQAVCAPMICFAPPAEPGPLVQARQQLRGFDWLVLTSRYAARALLEGVPAPAQQRPRVAALGKSTAQVIRALGWTIDLDGGGAGADALAAQLAQRQELVGRRVLYPRSSKARSQLPDTLRQAGATLHEVEAYQTLPPEPWARAQLASHLGATGRLFVFASPSAVEHTDEIVATQAEQQGASGEQTWATLRAVSIGPTTSRALRRVGTPRLFEAPSPDDDGLLEALVRAWSEESMEE
jgi:uroporphyrinogen-III synthase